MSLGRKPKNKFIEATLAFEEGSNIQVYDVQIPFVYKLTASPSDENRGYYEWEYIVKPPVDVTMLVNEIEKQGYKVTKVEPAVRKLINLCPRCHGRGIPKIEKKDTSDNRERSWRNKEQDKESKKERPPEFWLTYIHTKSKKCRIRQYVNTPYPAFKQNKIDIAEYFFPRVLERMKKISV